MPMYEYGCNKCNNISEEIRDYEERDDEMRCDCGGDMQRLHNSKTHFVLKGHGWTGQFQGTR